MDHREDADGTCTDECVATHPDHAETRGDAMDFEVTISCGMFDMTSPREAVEAMAEWLAEEGGLAVYYATDKQGRTFRVDLSRPRSEDVEVNR